MNGARRHLFKQADVARAIKGALAAGLKLARAEIAPDGRITITFADNGPGSEPETALDQWRAKHNARPS